MGHNLIGPGMQVELHFAIKLTDNTVVDSTFDNEIATFVVGDGNLLPGFEQSIMGLAPGDRKEILLTPEQGFGEGVSDNLRTISKHQFPQDIELLEGVVVSFTGPGGHKLPGVVKQVDADTVEVDFNHPLSGRNLIFEVQIFNVAPAPS